MGADFLCYILEMDHGEEPDWETAEKYIEETPVDELRTVSRELLKEYLTNLKDWWNGDTPRSVVNIKLKHTNALATGGMSWGDNPTEAFGEIATLDEAGILDVLGFR
ncbi:hypothetical protein AKJ47_01180 [candidate division MSBL1 archaeon SCGC-AAA261G05]|uniref:Uncharacterized protein n=3 Tax=candidate division MSBL1 TaxID=215777 RepID=A0A133V0A7_9EURY|nr:hypothetical protein AKJ42_02305 [candidate division MSBL1 archaeon SCGC-AAA261C02]KXB03994.1 hypothetical protein AKJ47_01180 [candidate division MSBL1 archaeon SCGC-AAA261G05]KXB04845.1 hypothetical protein AKJ48_01175 [candidate division MSBL1 archaeon SCGC-AAA261O19]